MKPPGHGFRALLIAAFMFVTLTGCAPLIVQSPGGALSPVNAVTDGDDARVMLFGADVVAYFTEGKHRVGDPAIKSVVEGVLFLRKLLVPACTEAENLRYG